MDTVKILYFHQHFSTPKGATGIRSHEMARALLSRGHRVTMVCGSYGGAHTGLHGPFIKGVRRGNVDGIEVIEYQLAYSNKDNFLKRTITFLKFAARSIGVALKGDYDLVFATSTPLTAGIPGIVARLVRRKPFVFEVRDLWPELPREMGVIKNPLVLAAMEWLEWLSYRTADRLIGLSPGIVRGIVRRGVPEERVAMIPNGCDIEIFASPHEKWRPSGVGPNDLMAVFSGTHGIANGLDAVLDAAKELKRRDVGDVKLVLIGDGQLKPRLVDRARREALNNVVFHPPVPKERLAGLLQQADLGLQILANVPAFYYGTSPNKFFDYLATGIPVLTNYPGWVADLIVEYRCGYAVPPGDPAAFADALEHANRHRDRLREMGVRASALAKAEFAREKLSARFADWLESAAKKRLLQATTKSGSH